MISLRYLAPAVALALAACASSPEPVAPSVQGISYKFDGDQLQEASTKAAVYCGQFGKSASLRSTGRQSGDNIAIFECR